MFGISNRIAYDGHMVHAPGPGNAGTIGAALGSSAWLDIDGEADSKWCPAEGELVVNLLQKIASAGITKPDLFVITPFRIVAHELRRRLEREAALFTALKVAGSNPAPATNPVRLGCCNRQARRRSIGGCRCPVNFLVPLRPAWYRLIQSPGSVVGPK